MAANAEDIHEGPAKGGAFSDAERGWYVCAQRALRRVFVVGGLASNHAGRGFVGSTGKGAAACTVGLIAVGFFFGMIIPKCREGRIGIGDELGKVSDGRAHGVPYDAIQASRRVRESRVIRTKRRASVTSRWISPFCSRSCFS